MPTYTLEVTVDAKRSLSPDELHTLDSRLELAASEMLAPDDPIGEVAVAHVVNCAAL